MGDGKKERIRGGFIYHNEIAIKTYRFLHVPYARLKTFHFDQVEDRKFKTTYSLFDRLQTTISFLICSHLVFIAAKIPHRSKSTFVEYFVFVWRVD